MIYNVEHTHTHIHIFIYIYMYFFVPASFFLLSLCDQCTEGGGGNPQ